jgi:hypothetical protein
MSGTKQTAIIVGSVAGGVVGGYILLNIGKMAWDRYKNATLDSENPHEFNDVPPVVTLMPGDSNTRSRASLFLLGNPNNAPNLTKHNEEDNQPIPAPPRIKSGSSKKSKKHKRRTRRRHKKN